MATCRIGVDSIVRLWYNHQSNIPTTLCVTHITRDAVDPTWITVSFGPAPAGGSPSIIDVTTHEVIYLKIPGDPSRCVIVTDVQEGPPLELASYSHATPLAHMTAREIRDVRMIRVDPQLGGIVEQPNPAGAGKLVAVMVGGHARFAKVANHWLATAPGNGGTMLTLHLISDMDPGNIKVEDVTLLREGTVTYYNLLKLSYLRVVRVDVDPEADSVDSRRWKFTADVHLVPTIWPELTPGMLALTSMPKMPAPVLSSTGAGTMVRVLRKATDRYEFAYVSGIQQDKADPKIFRITMCQWRGVATWPRLEPYVPEDFNFAELGVGSLVQVVTIGGAAARCTIAKWEEEESFFQTAIPTPEDAWPSFMIHALAVVSATPLATPQQGAALAIADDVPMTGIEM